MKANNSSSDSETVHSVDIDSKESVASADVTAEKCKNKGSSKIITLKKNHEYRRLYRRGDSAVGGCMVVYAFKNRLRYNRIGLTASTKLGNAVARNRARRRMREIYRLNVGRVRQGYDLVFVARARILNASWAEVDLTFSRLFKKLHLI